MIKDIMEKEIIRRWEANKEHLREYLQTNPQSEYNEYEKLVGILVRECLNYELKEGDWKLAADFNVIDHGEYQGTQIFLLHKDTYQPSENQYYVFDNYYGSCSGCDTLQGISQYDSKVPSDGQLDAYMSLLLHMIQRMKCLGNLWKEDMT